ncbi:hypothetical protein MJT46_013694 [Ovis ammon polii x Ovis aries]|nr:hypothetical protein MJT46_013694 [Ovis ammon polii x Ovis aries]
MGEPSLGLSLGPAPGSRRRGDPPYPASLTEAEDHSDAGIASHTWFLKAELAVVSMDRNVIEKRFGLLSLEDAFDEAGGCDSGFGHGLAKYLDELGFTVFAGVLDEQGSGAEELRRTCSKHLSVLQLNITNTQEIQEAYSKVKEKVQNKGLWAVINNAGVLGLPTDGELIPMTEYKRCMAVNFFGAVEVTKAFLPLLRKSKGRLVNISSMAGGVPMQKMAAYGSSKAALIMFSSILRQELSKWGVKVSVIQPGGFKTNISGTSQMWETLERTVLDNLSPEVQEDYGQDYILSERSLLRLMKTCTDPDISPVLLDVRHAISAQSPFAFYAPGKLSYPWLCFASFSPTGIFDYLSRKIHSYDKKMPRVLSTSNWENEAM